MTEIRLSARTWQLLGEINSGGFGRIYEAAPTDGTELKAVLKLIPKAPGAERELLFENLAGTSNVLPVIDTGEWDVFWVIAMPRAEYSLRDYLKQRGGKLTPDDAVRVLIDVAKALVSLEGKVTHRDIKPENILFFNGEWCLADFGISRYAEAITAPDTHKYSKTPPYAAPEQWREERATSASDVYTTGVVAYELLAGNRPFLGPDFRTQHLQQNPALLPDVPTGLFSLVQDCMVKSPKARPTPKVLLARLEQSVQPLSPAAEGLRAAFGREVAKKAEADRQASVARNEAERKAGLFTAAKESLTRLVQVLHAQVEAAAPGSAQIRAGAWTCAIGSVTINIPAMQTVKDAKTRYEPPFEIIAHTHIVLKIPRDHWGYEGRAHSLWFCDAKEEGVFRWYQTAFMFSPLTGNHMRVEPFPSDPDDDSYGALSTTMTGHQLAWPFEPIDQGEEAKFAEQWITWLVAATEGRLRHPTSMPERNTQGSWRRK